MNISFYETTVHENTPTLMISKTAEKILVEWDARKQFTSAADERSLVRRIAQLVNKTQAFVYEVLYIHKRLQRPGEI